MTSEADDDFLVDDEIRVYSLLPYRACYVTREKSASGTTYYTLVLLRRRLWTFSIIRRSSK